ncbi:GDSL esterase/lipase [Forsythia ovata]|uniref:GDSL esterase/lipase n=1 Tax=Forsythia ovata TaxID=205694 RepID=A0ABD1XDI2_9LAMI
MEVGHSGYTTPDRLVVYHTPSIVCSSLPDKLIRLVAQPLLTRWLNNHLLKEAVVSLRKDLPLAAFTYVDVYSVKYELISRAKKHGFVHPLRACCGHGGKYNYNSEHGCGSKMKVNGKEIMVGKSCKDPSIMINWDGVHYTEAANKWVFDQIVNGSFSDPPIPLNMACHTQ